MRSPTRTRTRLSVITFSAVLIPLLGWTSPEHSAARISPAAETCTFAILGSNNYSFDVFVNLYDAEVYRKGVGIFSTTDQLKIQNQRIESGKTMNRRYTAKGSCTTWRRWTFTVRVGSSSSTKLVQRTTEGTSSTSRTVDLGPASKW